MLAQLASEDDMGSEYWSFCLDSEVVNEQPASCGMGAASPGGVLEVSPSLPNQHTFSFLLLCM